MCFTCNKIKSIKIACIHHFILQRENMLFTAKISILRKIKKKHIIIFFDTTHAFSTYSKFSFGEKNSEIKKTLVAKKITLHKNFFSKKNSQHYKNFAKENIRIIFK